MAKSFTDMGHKSWAQLEAEGFCLPASWTPAPQPPASTAGRCLTCGAPTANLGGECDGCWDVRHGRRRPAEKSAEANVTLTPEQQAEVDAKIEAHAARVAADLERLKCDRPKRKGV